MQKMSSTGSKKGRTQIMTAKNQTPLEWAEKQKINKENKDDKDIIIAMEDLKHQYIKESLKKQAAEKAKAEGNEDAWGDAQQEYEDATDCRKEAQRSLLFEAYNRASKPTTKNGWTDNQRVMAATILFGFLESIVIAEAGGR